MSFRIFACVVAVIGMSQPAIAVSVLLHAAAALRGAFTEVAAAFEAAAGAKMQAKYGPSGLLKDEIAGGGKAEVFASANMGHPRALAQAKRRGGRIKASDVMVAVDV